ncbi:unnamed protein product [Polarella glacialis]|uniref:Uncharacterized protein n=1 Tax=Polarella glacialis TaxID=89957 RepID=A0A813KSS4_POLGL|nr:unnamed protein product [Polarella glacialis]
MAVPAEDVHGGCEQNGSKSKPKQAKSHPGRRRGNDSPAIASARNRDLEALRQLPADEVLAAVDHNGCGCLHWAAGNGDVDTCRYLVELSEGSATHALTWNQRTPLHYAARNGQTEACQWLAQQSADVNALARDEVSPLQLAVWQNHLETCRWFVEEAGVDPLQRNRFGCSIAHWVSQAPRERAGDPQGEALLPLARWLRLRGCDFSATQEHGHNALHKAGWSGHAELCRWLRDECGLRDGKQDEAGNFAADLAEMAGHHALADWLRAECSAARAASCRVLGVDEDADSCVLREAYLRLIRCTHPDSRSRKTPEAAEVSGTESADFDDFTALHGAYRHLVREGGRGSQRNPRHEERLMLCDVGGDSSAPLLPQPTSGMAQSEQREEQAPGGGPGLADIQLFKARLLTVICEFGSKGFPVSSLRKKYAQVWGGAALPRPADFGLRKGAGVLEMIRAVASDVVQVEIGPVGQDPLLHAISPGSVGAEPAAEERVQMEPETQAPDARRGGAEIAEAKTHRLEAGGVEAEIELQSHVHSAQLQ